MGDGALVRMRLLRVVVEGIGEGIRTCRLRVLDAANRFLHVLPLHMTAWFSFRAVQLECRNV